MRLDKFLKMSRLIKRRTLASELCGLGGVSVNGRVAKASTAIKEGDELELRFGNRLVQAVILCIPKKAAGNLVEAAEIATITHEQRLRSEEASSLPVDDVD